MMRENILKKMDEAFKEDRERFFKVADTLNLQPKYKEHLEELEELKQKMRDLPQQKGYPNITCPIQFPSWFPMIAFASSWEKDTYIEQMLKEQEKREES